MKHGARYGNGTIAESSNGRFDAQIRVAGQQKRARLPTLAAARAWIDGMMSNAGRELTRDELAGVEAAAAKIPPECALSIGELILAGLRATGSVRPAMLADAVEEFVSTRGKFLRETTVEGYRFALGKLSMSANESARVHEVERAAIERAVEGLSPPSRNGRLKYLSAFFEWAKTRGYCYANPCDSVERPRAPETSPKILTVAQTSAILERCRKRYPLFVRRLAIQLFAGLRPMEAARIGDDAIREKEGFIVLTGAEAKTLDARTIQIRPNLYVWLHEFNEMDSPTQRAALSRVMRLARDCGFRWPKDGARHSFASYAYETGKDAAAVAAELGHSGTRVFFRHYRALVLPGEGAKYFAIIPMKNNGKTTPPKKANPAL